MIKKLIACILVALSLTALLPLSAFGAGGNLDGTGGTLGNSRNNFYWTPTYCGARITVVTQGGVQVGESFDWLNSACYGANTYSFGNHSKLYYMQNQVQSISSMSMYYGAYSGTVKAGLPTMVKASGSNIAEIRAYFTDNGVLASIAARVSGAEWGSFTDSTGTTINNAIYGYVNGEAQSLCVVIEPIAAIWCGGVGVTGTATELAYWAQASAGTATYLASIVYLQVPLALYLETPQLGIQSNPSSAATRRAREDVISYLGVGIVSFGEDGAGFTPTVPTETPVVDVEAPPTSYDYHTNTEVYTSVRVENTTGADIKDTPVKLTFTVTGDGISGEQKYEQELIIPEDRAVLGYCSWTTPDVEGTINVNVEADKDVTLSCEDITCHITAASWTTPPDALVDDTAESVNGTACYYNEPSTDASEAASEWGHWEWTNTLGVNDSVRQIWDYNENGSTVYSDWEVDAWSSTERYADTIIQEIGKIEVEEYNYIGGWQSGVARAYLGETVPEASDSLAVSISGTKPVWRYRDGYYHYVISEQTYYYYYYKTEDVYTTVYHSGYWYNDGQELTTYLSLSSPWQRGAYQYVSGGKVYYKWYHRSWSPGWNETVYAGQTTSYGEGTSIPSGWSARYYNGGWGYWKTTNTNFDTYDSYTDGSLTGAQLHATSNKRYFYNTCTIVHNNWSAWQDSVPTAANGYGRPLFEYQQSTVTSYEMLQRELIKPRTYHYNIRYTDWSDSGSYWWATDTDLRGYTIAVPYHWAWVSEAAGLNVGASLTPDANNPTAIGNTIKSGYGVNLEVTARAIDYTDKPTTEFTDVQLILTRFPEFNYSTYARRLVSSGANTYTFAVNPYSRFNSLVHFTPIWYADDKDYAVQVIASDCWTPAGELTAVVKSNNLFVNGDVYDDWIIVPSD